MDAEKKLYRSATDRIIFGVCGGIAEYFSVDPVVVRVLFILLTIINGLGLVVYLILALALPVRPGEILGSREENLNQFAQSVGEKVKNLAQECECEKDGEGKACCPGSRRKIFGVILVVVGLLVLADRIFPMSWLQAKFLFPLVIVGFGFYIIFKK